MCTTIRFLNGTDIESISELEEYFKIDADDYKEDYYGDLEKDCCLCPIDLNKLLKDKPFHQEDGDWYENE